MLVFVIRKGPFAHPAHIPLCPFFSVPAAESLPFQRSVLGTQKMISLANYEELETLSHHLGWLSVKLNDAMRTKSP